MNRYDILVILVLSVSLAGIALSFRHDIKEQKVPVEPVTVVLNTNSVEFVDSIVDEGAAELFE